MARFLPRKQIPTSSRELANGALCGMQISDEALSEFIIAYKEEFGEEISRKDASEMALGVLRLYELLTRRLPNADATTAATTQPTDHSPPIGFRT